MIRMISGVLLTLVALVGTAVAAVAVTEKNAGSNVDTIQKVIDKTVWKAFQSAFEQLDGKALNSVYAARVLRVTPDGLDTNSQFKEINKTRFEPNIINGDRLALEFWFDSRHTNATTSYDVGFYRMSVATSAGETDYFYGQFHIVVQKIGGHWKIVQDWDTASIGGHPITAADFARRSPVQF